MGFLGEIAEKSCFSIVIEHKFEFMLLFCREGFFRKFYNFVEIFFPIVYNK